MPPTIRVRAIRPRHAALAVAALALPCAAHALVAFPGAQGHGARTPGGRGGKIMYVTTLADDGPGSFRAACAAQGPRIIVFAVGGVITLRKPVRVSNPFVTIAGQTAPGDGVCVSRAHLNIATHDVIVRGMRFRIGDAPDGPNAENRDGIGIDNSREAPHQIIIDHCSVCWAIDENLQTWYPCHDITIQWCISSEALAHSLHPKGEHSKGLLIGDYTKRLTVHHNLFAHNTRRNPLLKAGSSAEVVNNVIYNWGSGAIHHSNYEKTNEPIFAHHVGNYFRRGPSTRGREISIPGNMPPGSKVYVAWNTVHDLRSPPTDPWALVSGPQGCRVDAPMDELKSIEPENAATACARVLEEAGAIVPKRDAIDERIVKSVVDGTGRIIDSQKEVGDLPAYAHGIPPRDSDGDGVPDGWEMRRGLDPANPRDGNAIAASGYTVVEEYVNSLIPMSGVKEMAATKQASTSSRQAHAPDDAALARAKEVVSQAAGQAAVKLRPAIIAGIAAGRREFVYLDIGATATRGRTVSADDDAIVVQVHGQQIAVSWRALSPVRFANLAAKYAAPTPDNHLRLATLYAGGDDEEGRAALTRAGGAPGGSQELLDGLNMVLRSRP